MVQITLPSIWMDPYILQIGNGINELLGVLLLLQAQRYVLTLAFFIK